MIFGSIMALVELIGPLAVFDNGWKNLRSGQSSIIDHIMLFVIVRQIINIVINSW
jgi:hypothetical protein